MQVCTCVVASAMPQCLWPNGILRAVFKGNYTQLLVLLMLAVVVFAIPFLAKRRLAISEAEMSAMDGKNVSCKKASPAFCGDMAV